MKAVLCPVCNGVGQVSAGFYNCGGDCPYWTSSGTSPEMCRSCGGKGWVEAHEGAVPCITEFPASPNYCDTDTPWDTATIHNDMTASL